MALVNMTELILRERLDVLLEAYDCCKCETCYMDMLALALNCSKPRFVNTHQGELLKRLDASKQQITVDTDIAVIKAIELVSHAPHHENVIS